MTYQKITATFLDEITCDIPSQNWGPSQWAREFDTFAEAGIDTVVLIRAGLGTTLACPSAAVSSRVPTLPVYTDLVEMFLRLASERNISFYMGLYDSGYFWHRYDWKQEVSINREFIREALDRYGASSAFRGWYLPHETADSSLRIMDINATLSEEIRKVSSLPILISPYFIGRADLVPKPVWGWESGTVRGPEEHARAWEEIFGRFSGLVTQCAFQDGSADLTKIEAFTSAITEVAHRHGIELWSNLETFDRDMPIKFPPTDWRKLAHKLDVVQPFVSKIITFEFSHFLSPNSMWPSARSLYDRYTEHVAARRTDA